MYNTHMYLCLGKSLESCTPSGSILGSGIRHFFLPGPDPLHFSTINIRIAFVIQNKKNIS